MSDSKHEDATYDHVIKCTGLFGGVQGLNLLINVIRNKITSVLLGPQGTGIISLLSNFIELLHHSTDFGICFSAIKHVSELFETGDEKQIRTFIVTVRTWCLMAGLLGMFVALCIVPFITWTSTTNLLLIIPIIGILTVISGEQAILKGTKQLKKVAIISIFCTIATLIVTVPLFYLFRYQGIAAALLANHIAILIITLHYSSKVYRYGSSIFNFRNADLSYHFHAGIPMLVLGIGYVIAGIFGKGAEYVIRQFILSQHSTLEAGDIAVGLYTAGYSIVITYASYVFTAMEVDFFPRLSAAAHDVRRSNIIINQQIEVCALLMAPLLVGLVLFMPHMIHLLYANNYHAAIPMAVCAAMCMYFKAFAGPVEYLALAKGDSRMYMFVELAYDVFIAIIIPLSYKYYGLTGCGIALSLTGLINFISVFSLYSYRYKFLFDHRLSTFYVVQFIIILTTILAVMHGIETERSIIKWTVGPVCLILSSLISARILYRDTTILQAIWNKIRHR